jgi:hypothetical protein
MEVYRVELSDGVTVEVESNTAKVHEDDVVSVSPLKGPFPLVPG